MSAHSGPLLVALAPSLSQADVTQLLTGFRHLAAPAIRQHLAYNYPALLKIAAAHNLTHLMTDTFVQFTADQ